jgi:ABC-2 type transport system permease protein
MDYDQVLVSTIVVLLAFTATTVPSLVTRDRGDRVLSLYFSTALSPVEYVAGKVLAAWGLLLLITFGPLLVSWLGRLISAESPLDWVGDNADDLPRLLAAGLVVSMFHGTLALVLGSLTGRRVFAVGGYLAVMLVSPIVAGLVYGFGGERPAALLLDLASVPFVAARSVLGLDPNAEEVMAPAPGAWAVWAVVVFGGLLALLARYRSGREG